MGWFMKEAHARVVLVGLDERTIAKLRTALVTAAVGDPGTIELHWVDTIEECRELMEGPKELSAICLGLQSFPVRDCISFIADIRTTHPLITFCLVGTSKFLKQMPGYHEKWRERFRHYFQLTINHSDDDFDQNAGALRDLIIADSVKVKALGQYQTTPGALVRLKAAVPYGFWLSTFVVLLAGSIGPILDRVFPEHKAEQTSEVTPSPAQRELPSDLHRN
jgi:hypothetical protein